MHKVGKGCSQGYTFTPWHPLISVRPGTSITMPGDSCSGEGYAVGPSISIDFAYTKLAALWSVVFMGTGYETPVKIS
jgi:hypothetical protein